MMMPLSGPDLVTHRGKKALWPGGFGFFFFSSIRHSSEAWCAELSMTATTSRRFLSSCNVVTVVVTGLVRDCQTSAWSPAIAPCPPGRLQARARVRGDQIVQPGGRRGGGCEKVSLAAALSR